MPKLNLGCGDTKIEGFVNIDISETSATDKVMDVRRLDSSDNSIGEIYASHLIEHFPPNEIEDILKDWNRALEPGGKMTIVVPDFGKLVSRYLFFRITGNRQKAETILREITAGGKEYRGEDYHKIIFNYQKLKSLLEGAGFSGIKKTKLKDVHSLSLSIICQKKKK